VNRWKLRQSRQVQQRAAVTGLVGWLACGVLACETVPKQVVRLHVEPANASVFVDGKERAPAPVELALSVDRAHVLFFRAEGYRPEQIVLEPGTRAGRQALEPGEVRVRLEPLVPTETGISIEGAD